MLHSFDETEDELDEEPDELEDESELEEALEEDDEDLDELEDDLDRLLCLTGLLALSGLGFLPFSAVIDFSGVLLRIEAVASLDLDLWVLVRYLSSALRERLLVSRRRSGLRE